MSISFGEKKRFEYLSKPTKLIKLRMKEELSQVELSKALGLSRIHYGNVEKGLWNPRLEIAENIAGYFKVPLESLFKKVDETHYVVKK